MSGAIVPFSPEPEPVALVDMNVGQLAAAFGGLDRLEREYENMSGICATLKGLVLIEVKAKVGHGNYRAWLKEHFPKNVKTAERYKRLAEEFGKSDSTVAFQTLTRDLTASVEALKQFQLDLSHPMVAKIAAWVAGRGAYQLMLDFPGERGGHHPRTKPRRNLTPDEIAREEAQIYWLPIQQRIFELINSKPKDRLLYLPITASPEEASLAILENQVGSLHDLVKEALRQKRRAAR